MKYFVPLVLAAAGAIAASTAASTTAEMPSSTAESRSSTCEADYILEKCLETEQGKVNNCMPTDYECQCHAYEAISTCYNNCPKDPRASPAQNQVVVYCARVHTSSTLKTSTMSKTASEAMATEDDEDDEQNEKAIDSTATSTADSSEETGAAAEKVRNTSTMLLGIAGLIAAML